MRPDGQTHRNAHIRDNTVTNRKVLHVLSNLHYLANRLVAWDELSKAHVSAIASPCNETRTHWEFGNELALVDMPVCAAYTTAGDYARLKFRRRAFRAVSVATYL